MKEFALVQGGVVRAMGDAPDAFGRFAGDAIEVEKGSVDVDYIQQPDGSFKAPPEPEPVPEPLKPVTRKQLIDVLIEHDLDELVEPALNAIPDDKARKKALNAWQNASQYEPEHSLVLQLKGVLNLTDEQYDAFWREAMAS